MAVAGGNPKGNCAPPPYSGAEGLFAFSTKLTNEKETATQPEACSPLTLPAVYQHGGFFGIDLHNKLALVNWMQYDLNVSRLNKVEKHLWLAGPDSPAKPLHGQIAAGRNIVVTEKADMHLVWHSSTVWIKPLPEYLLCHNIWTSYVCNQPDLYGSALGFLWSYIWLVRSKSDLRIAHGMSLLPSDVSWERWIAICRAVMRNTKHDTVNVRYLHGELRLWNLNWIYRLSSEARSPTVFFRGYLYGYHSKSTFFRENTTWLVSVLVYVAIVLEAMQVGLATTKLGGDGGFQRASFGFTVLAILAPLLCVFIVLLLNVVWFIFNMLYTLGRRKNRMPDQQGSPAPIANC